MEENQTNQNLNQQPVQPVQPQQVQQTVQQQTAEQPSVSMQIQQLLVQQQQYQQQYNQLVDYVKTGAYIPELTTDNNKRCGIKLATSNQTIYKIGEYNDSECPKE